MTRLRCSAVAIIITLWTSAAWCFQHTQESRRLHGQHEGSSRLRHNPLQNILRPLFGRKPGRDNKDDIILCFQAYRDSGELMHVSNGSEFRGMPKPTNDWGIPMSCDLPRLDGGRTTKRIPACLPNGGKITLLGSGPGDPDLLTVAAYKMLTKADANQMVIADRLVSQEILDLIPKDVTVKVARKLPGCAELAQEEIYWWAYQGLRQGKHVIRLKIGDPYVFGRGGEEVLTFRAFGVEATVIPGVSAAFSAPLLGSIPVTHRGVSSQVVMCTGYGREGSSPDLIRYHKEQTVVFLMAVGRLRDLCIRLMDMAGYPSDTPVAIVEKAGCPDQRTVVGNMITIADVAEKHNIRPPSTIIVGDVVNVLLNQDHFSSEVSSAGLVQRLLPS